MPSMSAVAASVSVLVATVAVVCAHDLYASAMAAADFGLLWPPTRRSMPALIACSVFVAAICISSFVSASRSPEQRKLQEDKAQRIAAQLAEALRWDKRDETEETTGDESSSEEREEEKRPPEVKELFEMLYDEVEERHCTDFGIAQSDPDYVDVLKLFKRTVPEAMIEATRCTRIARGLAAEVDLAHGDKPSRVALFKDGYRLRELLKIYESKQRGHVSIVKAFGQLVHKDVLAAAHACRELVEREQREGGTAVLWQLVRPHLPLYVLSGLLMAFDSSVGATTWHGVAALLDGVDAGTMSTDELRDIFLRTYAKFFFCVFAHLTSCFFTEKIAGRFGNAVKSQVLRGVLRQDMLFFDVYPSGVIQERLNHDANDLTSKCFHLPMQLLHMLLMIISNAIAVRNIRPELLWICIAPIPIVAVVQKVFISRMNAQHKRGRKIAERVVANTNEVIKEMRTVRSMAMEGDEAARYDAQSQYRTRIVEETSIVHHCLFIAPLVMMFIATRLLATYNGGAYVAQKLITVGMAVQVGNAADHLQHCIRSLLEELPEMFKVLGPVGRICDAISSRPLIEPYPGGPCKLEPTSITGRIDFVDVDFTYPSEPQKQILFKLSFSADASEKVALVGSTGCGKSTALDLIQRFYSPTSGAILLDGRPIEEYDPHWLRRQISVVAQDNVLFSTTIRENITYGLTRPQRDALTDADVEDACRKANAWDFISGFPRRLETYAGERGVKLSGGQKQRLAIARAIIRRPTICLLDEATSALDSKAEGVVQAALDRMIGQNSQGCTLMIAHRLSTVKNCDRIVCLDKGHVLEQGTHAELLEINIEKDGAGKTVAGLYHDLWTTQMGASEATAADLKEAKASEMTAKERIAELEAINDALMKKLEIAELAADSVLLTPSSAASSMSDDDNLNVAQAEATSSPSDSLRSVPDLEGNLDED